MARKHLYLTTVIAAAVLAGRAQAQNVQTQGSLEDRCAALAQGGVDGVEKAEFHPLADAPPPPPFLPPNPPGLKIPAHCEISGAIDKRTGIDGQSYAIRYHLRLPAQWNGRFLFEGGGGTNGTVGSALGMIGFDRPPAIALGYAVVSQDSGHDNTLNNDPARGGQAVFGGDPEARANYGGLSLKRTTDTAKAVIARFYGRNPEHSYFSGCSKGGQEGMFLAQRYPDAFDGIIAAAPGFALPRAALAQTWDVQTFAPLARGADGKADFTRLSGAFTDAQFALVRDAVLAACDADDGLKDGIVGRFDRCTTAKVRPALERTLCKAGTTGACLSPAQLTALERSLGGPRDGKGKAVYAEWPWDGGIGAPGWRGWKLGSSSMPALNVVTGGPALAMIFSVPPTPLRDDPQSLVDYEMRFDFARDVARIYATDAQFPRSAWDDNSARSTDLSGFRAHGGKLIVPHGASDPVFSINDTLNWYRDVFARNGVKTAEFLRVFAVPGMNHCAGGPATDNFDAFTALVNWVEHGQAPDQIMATAGPASPWPGRTRPLCPYPKVATYAGKGSIEDAGNFVCK
jgi:feruloyl esterase